MIFLTSRISHFCSIVHNTAAVRQLKIFNEGEFLPDLRMNEWNRVSMLSNPNELWNSWKHFLMSVFDKKLDARKCDSRKTSRFNK